LEAPAGDAQAAPASPWRLLALSLSMLLPSLATSIANVALPALASDFGASFPAVQWVVLAYLLAVTSLVVGVGRLGDLLGRRRLLAGGVALFTAASFACGLAPSLELLIAARAVQGLGAAVMMALTVALVGEAVPKSRAGAAMGLLGSMSAVGTTLGPAAGGLLIAAAGWRAVFLATAPLGLLALALALAVLPPDRSRAGPAAPRFDLAGAALLAVALAAYALAMTLGRGSFGPVNLALLLAAGLFGSLFLHVQGRSASPLLRPELFRDPVLGIGLGFSLLVATVIMATLVVGPFHLSRSLGLGPAAVGLVMAAGPLMAALAGVPAGRLVDRFGTGTMTRVGLGLMAAGLLGLALAPAALGLAGWLCPVVLVTGAYALFQAANNTGVMAGAGPERRGAVSGLLSLSRNLGLITGVAVMGAVFALGAGRSDLTEAPPEAVAAGMRLTFLAAAGVVLAALALAARPTTASEEAAR
jgi:MFS family permease